jgi:hypothetical protein
MPRSPDSGHLNLADVFHRLQQKLLADLHTTAVFEHPSANGTATEQIWIELFSQFLPARYRAAPAFIINSSGQRSRQIDIAIFDALATPPLFPNPAGIHIPIESIYAVFEVKPTISKQWLQDAAEKAASVRALQTCPPTRPQEPRRRRELKQRRVLAGLLATTSVWKEDTFPTNLRRLVRRSPGEGGAHFESQKIDFGCALEHGSFEHHKSVSVSPANRALIFFLLRLVTRLNSLGPTPEVDLLEYLKRA